MKRTTGYSVLACLLVCAIASQFATPNQVRAQADAQPAKNEQNDAKAAIKSLLTTYRQSAAEADAEAFFGCLDQQGVFFGTDETQRFDYASFKKAFTPYFKKGVGWKRDVTDLKIYVGPCNKIGWFEEHSHRNEIGSLRTTGVVIKRNGAWRIVQYHTSLPIPDEIVRDVAQKIAEFKASPPAETDDAPLTLNRRRKAEESFEYIWTKVNDTYWDENLGGVDWQAAYDELRPQLDDALTVGQARSVMNELLERMKVSHFGVIPESAYRELGAENDKGARGGVTGIHLRIVDDEVIIVQVDRGSPADESGIRCGWTVEKIDGKDVASLLAKVKSELKDNPHARTIIASAANSRIRGKTGDQVKLTLRDGDNRSHDFKLKLVPGRGERVQFGHIPEFRVWVDVETIDNDIGYFRFNAFANPVQVMTAYNQFIKDNMENPGIVIDVRGNGGGQGEIAMGMIGWLMPGEKAILGRVVFRDDELKLIVRPRAQTYPGEVVLLIDEMSVSAAELFARGMKDLAGARIIGTRTAGAVLGSQIEKLPNGDGFQYAAVNFISNVTGNTLEGIGVSPHQVVQPDKQSLLAGKDAVIEAAVNWIRTKTE